MTADERDIEQALAAIADAYAADELSAEEMEREVELALHGRRGESNYLPLFPAGGTESVAR